MRQELQQCKASITQMAQDFISLQDNFTQIQEKVGNLSKVLNVSVENARDDFLHLKRDMKILNGMQDIQEHRYITYSETVFLLLAGLILWTLILFLIAYKFFPWRNGFYGSQGSNHDDPHDTNESLCAQVPVQHLIKQKRWTILDQIDITSELEESICILSFHEETQDLHHRIITSVFQEEEVEIKPFLLEKTDPDVLDIPRCQFVFVFVDFNETNVILENPGDKRLVTVQACMKFGADVFVIYTRDRDSSHLGDDTLYNKDLSAFTGHFLLKKLTVKNRGLSTSDSPTDPQVAIGGDPNDQSAHVTETILKILWTIKLLFTAFLLGGGLMSFWWTPQHTITTYVLSDNITQSSIVMEDVTHKLFQCQTNLTQIKQDFSYVQMGFTVLKSEVTEVNNGITGTIEGVKANLTQIKLDFKNVQDNFVHLKNEVTEVCNGVTGTIEGVKKEMKEDYLLLKRDMRILTGTKEIHDNTYITYSETVFILLVGLILEALILFLIAYKFFPWRNGFYGSQGSNHDDPHDTHTSRCAQVPVQHNNNISISAGRSLKIKPFLLEKTDPDVLNIPRCQFIFVFVDFNETNVILENPGDKRLVTVQACMKMGGKSNVL
ncbi:unnamed protein product [Mytilus edulis]|uniref:Uncharacterized protein n=1 Tax=Mytilus edulis TaxID=6550 RepID=A0A8S3RAU8_MYTED|nr:unnamed protein product [Mytilus edulis]